MSKEYSKKIKSIDDKLEKMRIKRKDSDYTKVKEDVFDTPTLISLYNLSNKDILYALGGAISTGKEANIFFAESSDKPITLKIYRITTSTFRAMEEYILGDPRFKNIRHEKRDIILAWTRKEYRNLIRAQNAGIRVPSPITTEKNILVMDFLGENEISYPLLKEVKLDTEQAHQIYETIKSYMRKLYKHGNLVHGDLSEYNIMIDPNNIEPIFIDMGQSVTLDHPKAEYFLNRDIKNITRFFKRFKISDSPEDLSAFVRN
ncbi:serine protein kinase RIO [Methanohalobium sp.]|uniref:serine protein kinase RIO n=1 Tax=Methanohalobium sp. TaxID=2837493 RepID=UPI0025E8BDDF|nr:serine protein kinase RIO [Methanohalobium sp.]